MAPALQLSEVIRTRSVAILEDWLRALDSVEPAGGRSRRVLLNHMPALLEALATALERIRAGQPPPDTTELAEAHALDRLDIGFNAADLVEEFRQLRRVVLRTWQREAGRLDDVGMLEHFNDLVDASIAVGVNRYSEARNRALEAMDKLSAVAAEAPGEPFLPRLVEALKSSVAAVDTVTVFLVEAERLVVRASIGLLHDLANGFSLRTGEGFAGPVAQTRTPLQLRDARTDPMIVSDSVRRQQLRALFGVPLLHGDELVGVACMGSTTATEFSLGDRMLLHAMARRATGLIVQERLLGELARQREELERAHRRVQAILDSAIDSIVTIDERGRITDANPATQKLFGYTRAELLGRNVAMLMPEPHRSRHDEYIARYLRTGEARIIGIGREVECVRKDGSRFPADLAISEANVGGRRVFTGILRDATERKRSEEFKDRLLGIVSHDLRTPLNSVHMSAQMLLRSPDLPEPHRKTAQRIQRNSAQMMSMISALLDFTRGRLGGGIPVERRRVELSSIVRELVATMQFTQATRVFKLNDPGEVWGDWDPDRVAQAIGNLVSNAVQYGAEDAPIRITVRAEEGAVEVDVHNEGPVIPEDKIGELFEPFRRGGEEQRGGLGLGLYIVSEIARAHGGSVRAASSAEQGTTFTLRLPRR